MKRPAADMLALTLTAGAPPLEWINAWDTRKPSASTLDTEAPATKQAAELNGGRQHP